jgi:hypothetical protein
MSCIKGQGQGQWQHRPKVDSPHKRELGMQQLYPFFVNWLLVISFHNLFMDCFFEAEIK